MKIKGAIFDMDGTVIDSLMFWDHLWRKIGEKYMGDADFRPSEEVDKRLRTMIFTDGMAYFKESYGIPGDTDEFVSFASKGLADFYREVAAPKAGAIALLEYLKERGIKVCLASATAMAEVRLALEYHGMLGYFDPVLSCADIGVGKDKPDIYLQAMSIMGLSPSDICVFEDSYVALETARRVGFQTVGIYDRYNFEQGRLSAASDIYLGEGQSLEHLIGMIDAQ